MARNFAAKITYPASLEELEKAFTDRRFYELRAAAAKATLAAFSCKRNSASGELACTTEMRIAAEKLPLDRVPSKFQKLIPATIHATMLETWSADLRQGAFRLTASGIPVTVTGTSTLEVAATQCVRMLSGEVKVAVPLLGNKIENALPLDKISLLTATEESVFKRYHAGETA